MFLRVLTCSVLVWNSLSSSSVRGRKLSSFSGYSCQPMAFSNLHIQHSSFSAKLTLYLCVCVLNFVSSVVLPVLCLQGAGQVFSVGVTEGVGETVLVADFFAVGFGLWGAAFTLRKIHMEKKKKKNTSKNIVLFGFLSKSMVKNYIIATLLKKYVSLHVPCLYIQLSPSNVEKKNPHQNVISKGNCNNW